MILATPSDVLKRIGLAESEDRLSAVQSALFGVTYKIEADIRTTLSQQARIDYFSPPTYRIPPKHIQLNLTQGFVDSTVAVVVTVSSSGYVADATTPTVLADSEYEIDFTKGQIVLSSNIYSGTETVSVAYTAGFAKDIQDRVVNAPSWLEEAAKAAAVLVLNAENFSRQKSKSFQADNNMANRMYTGIVNSHVRARSSGLSVWRGVEV